MAHRNATEPAAMKTAPTLRQAATTQAMLILANDLAASRRGALKAIDLAVRRGGSAEALRSEIERVTESQAAHERDLMRWDAERHAAIADAAYADEAGAD